MDFKTWYREAHGERTPWGDEESEALMTSSIAMSSRTSARRGASSGSVRRRSPFGGEGPSRR
ncbi:MAG: hypothetical protein R6W48_11560, partial [Gaiellaceae bacterium]